MAKTINWANVSIGFDSSKVKAGVDLARNDFSRLTTILKQTADPMKLLERDQKILDTALQKGAISVATYERSLSSLKSKYGEVNAAQSLFSSSIGKAGAVVAGAGLGYRAISGTTSLLSDSLKTIDEQANISRSIGVNINDLRKFAFEQQMVAGIDFNQSVEALQQLTKMVGLAAIDVGKGKPILEKLGLDPKTLAALSPVQQFKEITTALQGIEDQATRAAIADKLFGDAKLVQAVTASKQEIEAAEKAAANFVQMLSDSDVKGIESLNDQLEILDRRMKSISDRVVSLGAPTVLDAINNTLNGIDIVSAEVGAFFQGEDRTGRQAAMRAEVLKQIQREVDLHKSSDDARTKASNQIIQDTQMIAWLKESEAQAALNEMDTKDKAAKKQLEYERDLLKLKEQQREVGARLVEKYDPIAKVRRELKDIMALLDAGAINQQTFDKERRRILADANNAQRDSAPRVAPLLVEGTKEAFKQQNDSSEQIIKLAEEDKLAQEAMLAEQKEAVAFLRKIADNAIKAFR